MKFTGTEKIVTVNADGSSNELDALIKEAEDLSKKKHMKYEWVEAPSL